MEVRTYRFRGHSMSDPVSGTYRSKEEVSERTEKDDPIKILRDRLFDAGILTQEALEAMDQEVTGQVQEAADFADAAPAPGSVGALHPRLFPDQRTRPALLRRKRPIGSDPHSRRFSECLRSPIGRR